MDVMQPVKPDVVGRTNDVTLDDGDRTHGRSTLLNICHRFLYEDEKTTETMKNTVSNAKGTRRYFTKICQTSKGH